MHHYIGDRSRYSKSVAQGRDQLPGTFLPAFPFGGTPAFLFHKIEDNVAAAEILREEAIDGESVKCQVISAAYRQPHHDPVLDRNSSITFWVDSSTHLVLRMAGQTTHRLPAHDETHTTKFNVAFTRLIKNQPIAPEAFEYAPPANTLDASDPHGRSGFISGGGGGGGVHPSNDKKKSYESWHSTDWAGGTLIERSKLRFAEVDLQFERRLTFSEDRKELEISERITGPKSQTEREISVPIA